ncbi:AsnC family transcriptional regulator [Natrinema pellirubrum DSM 15624]|uniref:Transcriptional regulator n=2 Tax=Natrinema TaxID=88723 RepID=L0JHJ5_NATP1|nr:MULTISPECIES: Lrp/AsnC family transcriptional regulator [Natrinema]ELZ12336.1 AsnC family transcriptional regulator [Natrinema thermotolerans DSM 11552]AGB31015.1 transcriptional regulator [Natrinema pellirubrum DSM 15624]ELY81139.1 AsnC family transcriptional regulator [Natrinema pellirubrum DSM 15624]QCC59831.1 Lrp/AsnC family transcriptional regulator [Natrinema thermotolerans]WMT06822.1 Lrp/AsnC family transcriptional regulator [Natrinema thermotolerans]
MDERNVRILQAVAELGTGSPDEISEYTDIPKSTVHYRLTKLKEDGVVTNDLLDVNLEALGLEITVVTEVIAEYDEQYHEDVGEQLAAIEGANQVYFTMGDTDFIVIAHLADREMVNRLISDYEAIDEVVRTSSQFVVETVKDEPHPLNDFELETLVESTADED